LHSQADSVEPLLLAHMGDRPDDEMAHLLDQPSSPYPRKWDALRRRFGIAEEGKVITTELHPGKAARENLRAAGLLDYVDLREGDALETRAV
jgi:hypothetical protein